MKQGIYKLSLEEKHTVLHQLARVMEQRNNILFAYAYGSFAGDMPFHDIDVGIYLSTVDQASTLRTAADLAGELEQTVHFPVDVRILNAAPTLFTYHVIQGLVIVEQDADLRSDLVEQTVRKYLDLKPLITRGIREAFAA